MAAPGLCWPPIMWAHMRGFPCIPSDDHSTIVLRGLMVALNCASIMPRDASLSDSRRHFFPSGQLYILQHLSSRNIIGWRQGLQVIEFCCGLFKSFSDRFPKMIYFILYIFLDKYLFIVLKLL